MSVMHVLTHEILLLGKIKRTNMLSLNHFFKNDINIYFALPSLKVDPNLPWNLGEINVSKKERRMGRERADEKASGENCWRYINKNRI